MYLTELIPLKPRSDKRVLMALADIPAGEPVNLCTDLEEHDLNEYVTGGRRGVFLAHVGGDSMETEIRKGDVLIINQNLSVNPGDIILAYVGGAYTIKQYQPKPNGLYLVPKNENYESRLITAKDDFETFGVIVGIVRWFKKNLAF